MASISISYTSAIREVKFPACVLLFESLQEPIDRRRESGPSRSRMRLFLDQLAYEYSSRLNSLSAGFALWQELGGLSISAYTFKRLGA